MTLFLLICSIVILACVLFHKLSSRLGVPALLAFILHSAQTELEERRPSRYIRRAGSAAGMERGWLQLWLLFLSGMYLGYQYLGKLTLLELRWPPV